MARGYNKEFVSDIEKFKKKSEDTVNDARRFMAYSLFKKIIDRTPVYFEWTQNAGNAKNNWTCSINTLVTTVNSGTDKKGSVTKARVAKVLKQVQGDDDIYFSNSVSQIFMLEDGLYPKNVSKGSWNSQTKKFEIRSIGGFSKQAPKGMVKLSLVEFPNIYKRSIKKAQAQNK